MNYGDHNFIEITQQTKLRVALVVSSGSIAVLFDNVDQPKCMGSTVDTSNVSSRVESSQVEFGLYALDFVHLIVSTQN